MKTRLPDESLQLHVSPSGSTLKKVLTWWWACNCMYVYSGLVILGGILGFFVEKATLLLFGVRSY